MESPGTHLSDYVIEQELGQGSYGMVYKVQSLKNKQVYVIKKINIEYLPTKSQKEVVNEAQILKKLDHPHIVKYFCSFLEGKHLCIVMEYINGGDLHRLIKTLSESKSLVPESDIWRMALELSSAVAYLHSKNIIHRDIKTLNVLVTKDLTIKLADLGASKIVSAPMQVTRVGTPLYLAPELVKHKPYDYKVDVWALGCVLYTLAKLQPPFQGENLITLGIQIVNREPEPIPAVYSSQLVEFIGKLLTKQPTDRPSSSALLKMIPKGRDLVGLVGLESLTTEVTVCRNSPVVEEISLIGKFARGRPADGVVRELEPKACVVKEREKEKEKKKDFECFTPKAEDRPSTASRNRVIIRTQVRTRPCSASTYVKKNPLFVPREPKVLKLTPPCINFDFSVQRPIKKHLTINDLYS